jgi:hypothetical protein
VLKRDTGPRLKGDIVNKMFAAPSIKGATLTHRPSSVSRKHARNLTVATLASPPAGEHTFIYMLRLGLPMLSAVPVNFPQKCVAGFLFLFQFFLF